MQAYHIVVKLILLSHQSGYLGRGIILQNTIIWNVIFDETETNGEAAIHSIILYVTATKSRSINVMEG